MLHRGAAHSFPTARNVPTACVWKGAAGQGALPASVARALHMTTATDQYLPIIDQHDAEAGGAIPPQIMTVYTYEAAMHLEISTRSTSDARGFVSATCTTDHASRPSGRLYMGLALLGETDAVFCYGRISGLDISTDCDFGESKEHWRRAGSGGHALIFARGPATARFVEIVSEIRVDLRTSGHEDLAAHASPNRVCLFEGLPPKKIEKNNSSALEICSEVTSVLTGRRRAEAAQTEGVRRYRAFAVSNIASTHVQGQGARSEEGLKRSDTVHHVGDGRRVGYLTGVALWITALVCSSYVIGGGICNRRLSTPLRYLAQRPCWEARFSGRRGLARPALRLVSGFQLLARRRGTPGSGSRSPEASFSMSEAVAPSAPTDATMSVAKSGKRYSETVSSFHIFELPESSRKSALAPLFQQDISFPMSGPFFIEGDTAEDANQLMLRMTRAATAFTLLIDVDCTGPAATAMERLLLKRQQILAAVQGIDGANGRSVKAGASPTIFSSLTVDSDGRPAASGTNLASFHLKLQTLNFPSAPLWQESLEVLRKSNLLLVTDDVTRKGAWPTYGGEAPKRRILLPALSPDVSNIAAAACTSILVISEVVRAALDYRKVAHSEVVLARMPLNDAEGCILICLNPVLMSYLLLTCEQLSTWGVQSFTTELQLIRKGVSHGRKL